MSSLFDDLKEGLEEAIDYEKGTGVAVKTVEAWEGGRTHPTGPAFRLMDLLSNEEKMEYIVSKL